jgi:hypothetical protein
MLLCQISGLGCLLTSPYLPSALLPFRQVLSGHVHSYERLLGQFNWAVDPCGPAYLVLGGPTRQHTALASTMPLTWISRRPGCGKHCQHGVSRTSMP